MGLLYQEKQSLIIKMVLVSKEDRRKLFNYLLREGVIVVKKDAYMPKHQNVPVANLHAMMVVKSLKSHGCLNEVYNWGRSYYFLTNKGVAYLIKELDLPVDKNIVPLTHNRKRVKQVAAPEKEGKEEAAAEEETPKDE